MRRARHSSQKANPQVPLRASDIEGKLTENQFQHPDLYKVLQSSVCTVSISRRTLKIYSVSTHWHANNGWLDSDTVHDYFQQQITHTSLNGRPENAGLYINFKHRFSFATILFCNAVQLWWLWIIPYPSFCARSCIGKMFAISLGWWFSMVLHPMWCWQDSCWDSKPDSLLNCGKWWRFATGPAEDSLLNCGKLGHLPLALRLHSSPPRCTPV